MTEREQFEVEFVKLNYQWSDANKDKAFLGWQMARAQPAQAVPTEHDCDCGRKWKHTAYGWVATEPAQAVPMTDPELVAAVEAAGFKTWDTRMWELKRQIEAHHGIVGKEGA